MINYITYLLVAVSLLVSYFKDKKKTKKALTKALKSFENISPQFLGVIMVVGILMSILNEELLSEIIGSQSGFAGVIFSAIVGSITLIPGFIAFPTAAMLIDGGAGYMQIGAFVSTLMMVGVVTIPVEIKYFGKKLTIVRNILAFIFSFFVAYIIGKVAGGI